METKEVKIRFTVVSLLKYLAIAAAVVGLLYGILTAIGLEHVSGTLRFSMFLLGLFYAVIGGGLLYGLSELITLVKK
jgi:hypothetical protein